MSRELRKIGFYSIKLQDKERKDLTYSTEKLKEIINFIMNLSKEKRKVDIEKTNKFYFLKQVENKNSIQNIIFESAKYNHRPPLIDKETLNERDNPKKLTEGELEKTHVALKYKKEEIIVVLEERKAGVTIHQIISYFYNFAKMYYQSKNPPEELLYYFSIGVIPKGEFLAELKKLSRAIRLEVFLNKQLLGSEFLKYANKTEEVKDEIILTIKAQRMMSLKELAKQFFNEFGVRKAEIKKIRVIGISEEGNKVLLDTDIIKKVEYIETELERSTGVVRSNELFYKLNEILRSYND